MVISNLLPKKAVAKRRSRAEHQSTVAQKLKLDPGLEEGEPTNIGPTAIPSTTLLLEPLRNGNVLTFGGFVSGLLYDRTVFVARW